MDALVTFLRARCDDDERDIAEAEWPRGHTASYRRAVREVEAKRRIIGRYECAAATPASVSSFVRGQDEGYLQACFDAIRDLSQSYADHPDYRAEWRP